MKLFYGKVVMHHDDAKNERGYLHPHPGKQPPAVPLCTNIGSVQGKGTQKQLEFVEELFREELDLRDGNRRNRLIKRAGFPVYKTFEGYGYDSVKFPPAFGMEGLERLDFVPERKNPVLYGPVGIGKTHMAIAAGVKACQLGYKTKFHTVTELVLKLAEARKNGTLERLLKELRALDLLILEGLCTGR